ncbi:MAG: hypothetical protein K9N06_08315 [Candidatus Cloacimonetes bacterium]|nr:hypothetical protein [Candidatus Cloacimonadota bacterium]
MKRNVLMLCCIIAICNYLIAQPYAVDCTKTMSESHMENIRNVFSSGSDQAAQH